MDNKEKFIAICKEKILKDGLEKLLEWLETTDIFQAPASTKFHSNHEGGLCEHSIRVYEQLIELNRLYGNGEYSDETLAIVALFHDLCKVNFYKKKLIWFKDERNQWQSKDGWEIDEKVPLGHGEKSVIILQKYLKLTLDEILAIRWHMGLGDNAVKGGDYGLSKAEDMSKLVTLLHVADVISSNLLEEKII